MEGKYIRIIQALYSAAKMRVRTPEGSTKSLNVTKGVLQGEILSPFLFTIYLNDVESYLANRTTRGVQVDRNKTVHLLAYADDIVILGDSPGNLQQKLAILKEYCTKKGSQLTQKKLK